MSIDTLIIILLVFISFVRGLPNFKKFVSKVFIKLISLLTIN